MSSQELSDDSDLDDIPLTLDYESRYLDDDAAAKPSAPIMPSVFARLGTLPSGLSNAEEQKAPPTARGPRQQQQPLGFDLSLKKLPKTPEHDGEPLPSSRQQSGAVPPAFNLSLQARQQLQDDDSPRLAAAPTQQAPMQSQHAPVPVLSSSQSVPCDRRPPAVPALRALKPPRLNLENPATASPISSPLRVFGGGATQHSQLHIPSPSSSNPCQPAASLSPEPSKATGSSKGRLLINLLSPAFNFNLDSDNNSSSAASETELEAASSSSDTLRGTAVCQRISASLMLPPSQLRCFVLQEVSWEQLACTSSTQAAVMVKDSSFSLPALEAMLKESKEVAALQHENARTIASLHAENKALQAEYKSLKAESAEKSERQAVRSAQLEKDLEHSQKEVAELRSQLAKCDEQRMQFRSTLAMLRNEFELSKSLYMAAAASSSSQAGATTGASAAQSLQHQPLSPRPPQGASQLQQQPAPGIQLPSPRATQQAPEPDGAPPLRVRHRLPSQQQQQQEPQLVPEFQRMSLDIQK